VSVPGRADATASVAGNAALARLSRSPRPRLLFVSHGAGGGVGRHVAELAAMLEEDAEVLLLQPHSRTHLVLRWMRAGEDAALWFPSGEWDEVVALLERLGIARLHVHHVHGLPPELLALPQRLGCPCDVTLHDYFPVCPAYHLLGADGAFCGGTPECRQCTAGRAPQWPLSLGEWRASFGAFLRAADRVICPSEDTAVRLRRHFPGLATTVWPHPEAERQDAAVPVRVLVPGALSPAKGLEVLEACARDAQQRRLPLHFRVLGYTAHALPAWPEAPLSLAGEYPDGRLPELLALERGDAIFFPAQCAETFSYTLSAALDTGLPVIATDLGALPERLAHRDNACIVHWSAPPARINDTILAFAARPPRATLRGRARMTFADYRRLYTAPFAGTSGAPRPQTSVAPAAALPPVPAERFQSPPGDGAPWTLEGLLVDGVDCGRASSLALLRQRVRQADAAQDAAAPLSEPGRAP
jgi:glycosyltransferase involved in cell wall biosynthesis